MSNIAKMIAIAKRFGGGSGPSEVVILPETEMTVDEEGAALITEPLQKTVAAGDTLSIVYNGTAYECTGVTSADSIVFGNIEALGLEGGNPNAPFVVGILFDGADSDGDGAIDLYGMVMPMDGSTTVTLSIVQTEGAASGGESAGGGVVVATAIIADDETVSSIDKTYAELLAAFDAGKPVQMIVKNSMADFMMPLIIHLKLGGDYLLFGAYTDTKNMTLKASLRYNADGTAVYAST